MVHDPTCLNQVYASITALALFSLIGLALYLLRTKCEINLEKRPSGVHLLFTIENVLGGLKIGSRKKELDLQPGDHAEFGPGFGGGLLMSAIHFVRGGKVILGTYGSIGEKPLAKLQHQIDQINEFLGPASREPKLVLTTDNRATRWVYLVIFGIIDICFLIALFKSLYFAFAI